MKKLAFVAGFLGFVSSLVLSASAFATSAGYLAGGPDIYQVRNVTTNTGYSSNVSVACNETVKYSVKLSNTEYGLLSNVTVKAPLNGTMTATATNSANENVSTTGTVSVSAAAGSYAYIAGSTQLLNADGGLIKALPDGVTTNGVNAGNLNGSTIEFVQFQAKLTCETPPVKIQVCDLSTKQIITIDEKDFDSSKQSKDLSKCKEVPPTKIQVCKLDTKTIVTINESDFDSSKYSKDLTKCATSPAPGKLQVCDLSTKSVITINENEFDSSKYSKNLNDCAQVLPAETTTPSVLPSTGPEGVLMQVFGASSLVGSAVAYIRSRKLLG